MCRASKGVHYKRTYYSVEIRGRMSFVLNYKPSSCILQEHVLGLMVTDAILGRAAIQTNLIIIHVNVLTDLVEVIAQQVRIVFNNVQYTYLTLNNIKLNYKIKGPILSFSIALINYTIHMLIRYEQCYKKYILILLCVYKACVRIRTTAQK